MERPLFRQSVQYKQYIQQSQEADMYLHYKDCSARHSFILSSFSKQALASKGLTTNYVAGERGDALVSIPEKRVT